MRAKNLYGHLECDFITAGMSDEWVIYMNNIEEFLCNNFRKRSIGLVCDFADEITHSYSAVFPSDKVMQQIIDDDAKDALLFVRHPSIWDIRKAPNVFVQMNRDLLQQFKQRRIAIYNLHTPLNAFGKYSTSTTLARALDIIIEQPFATHNGVLCGVIGVTDLQTVDELHTKPLWTESPEVFLSGMKFQCSAFYYLSLIAFS